MVDSDEELLVTEQSCFFKCDNTNKLITAGRARIDNIIACSKLRGDGLHVDLENRLIHGGGGTYTIICHKSCVSTYTSKDHLRRLKSAQTDNHNAAAEPPLKRICRSHVQVFNFRRDCLFCGEKCQVCPNPRHPDRWRRVVQCSTAEHGYGNINFKQAILDVCEARKDDYAERIRIRLQGAVCDLHAADAMYHKDCSTTFMSPRSIATSTRKGQGDSMEHDVAFEVVVDDLNRDHSQIWNSVELHSLYRSNNGINLSRNSLMKRLLEHFGSDLLILSGKGVANILVFRSKASSTLRLVDDEEDDISASMEKLSRTIVSECKLLRNDNNRSYNTRIDRPQAIDCCSPTLLGLLSHVSSKLESSLPAVLIGNMLTSTITNQPTTLQVGLGILIREKSLIEQCYKFGITCSYDEVLRFKASSAAASSQKSELTGLLDCDVGLVQAVADNFDADISSPNGLRSTHSLALLLTQVQGPEYMKEPTSVADCEHETIRRLRKEEMKNELESSVCVQRYSGPKKPAMDPQSAVRSVLPLKVLANQILSVERAKDIDFDFLKTIVSDKATPEFNGFNTRMTREQGQSILPATKAVYTPLIDMIPSDPDTMMTAMVEAQRLTNQTGQTVTIFTADQQLYRVVVNITWVYPNLFKQFIPRLGGMHLLMSFCGSIGTLMENSGLEDVMQTAFGGVAKMLLGKKFPQNCRALRMVLEEVLRGVLDKAGSHSDLMEIVESLAAQSRTTRHWVENFIKPVLLIMMYVRAEREADWPLHLWTVRKMLPYFFAAGHTNYSRYGLYYLRSMEKLPRDVLKQFCKGDHVMRHNPGLWNGIWSDMYIETTFMRYGHGPGGIIGITLKPSTLTRWALSLHICSRLIRDISSMTENVQNSVVTHKEEMPSRLHADAGDRRKLREKLQCAIDPLDPTDHPANIVNVVTGQISAEMVTVENSVCIGETQMAEFESSLPEGFNSTIPKKVVTMAVTKRHIKVGQIPVYDTNLIYSRVLGLQQSRGISLKDVIAYELSPVPTSLFEDSGDLRITKSKSVLKSKLQIEHSGRQQPKSDCVVIDGCALLWVIHWPASAKVIAYADNFISYIKRQLESTDVYLVFDRYNSPSIKDATRLARAGKDAVRVHQLNVHAPLPSQKVTLCVTKNKVQLIEIICQLLKDQAATLSETHTLVVTHKNPTPFEISNGRVTERDDLRTTHEEADVIIVQQVVKLARSGTSKIDVVCDDTDVFILLIHFYSQEKLTCQLLMVGTSSNRKVVDIKATSEKHSDIADQLLAAHVLTGCDTVSQLFGIGKGTVIKKLKSHNSLNNLGKTTAPMEKVIEEATFFIAACYGSTEKTSMSSVRYSLWASKMSNPKLSSAPQLKTLPPTTESFNEHVHRAHFQAAIWRCSLDPDPPSINADDCGWTFEERTQSLVPTMLPPERACAPENVLQLIRCGCSSEMPCSTTRCGCCAAQLSCSMFCSCHQSYKCYNEKTVNDMFNDESDGEDYLASPLDA